MIPRYSLGASVCAEVCGVSLKSSFWSWSTLVCAVKMPSRSVARHTSQGRVVVDFQIVIARNAAADRRVSTASHTLGTLPPSYLFSYIFAKLLSICNESANCLLSPISAQCSSSIRFCIACRAVAILNGRTCRSSSSIAASYNGRHEGRGAGSGELLTLTW